MRLTKASATGNDFILVDLLDEEKPAAGDRAAFARRACARHEGVGADGLVFLEPTADPGVVRWDFFNADGGRAEMCGNATRAAGLYLSERLGRDRLTIVTAVGAVDVTVHSAERIEATLPALGELRTEGDYVFVRAGVPHAVVRAPDAHDRTALRPRALAIKARPEFVREGINVTFFTPTGAGAVDAITFERGVEDFTLSCGTGAVAAAFASAAGSTVRVRVPGGEVRVVCDSSRPMLTGPARLIARLEWLNPQEIP